MSSVLKPWLLAQLVWLFMAVLYNVAGLWNMANGERALVGDAPGVALASLCLPGLVILFGFLGWQKLYRYLLPLWFVLFALVGFGRHLLAAQTAGAMAAYSSESAWWSAVLINGYGMIVFAAGLYVAWKFSKA